MIPCCGLLLKLRCRFSFFLCRRTPSINAPAPTTITTTNPNGSSFTIPPELSKVCADPPCNVTVEVNGVTYMPGDTIPSLPLGTTNLTYTIVDSQGVTRTDTTSVTLIAPPRITAPPAETLNATNSTGVATTIPPPTNQSCYQTQCTVSVYINGSLVPLAVGDPIVLPPNSNTTITYKIVDASGQSSTDKISIVVLPYVLLGPSDIHSH